MIKQLFIFCLVFLFPVVGFAAVYKHVDENGKVTYSDSPIAGGELVDVKAPNTMDAIPEKDADLNIYKEPCDRIVLKNKLCSVKLLEKRSDFAMIRVHYHYVKGKEDRNRIIVKANKGSHDNVIGTRGTFSLQEGNNVIDIPFGIYRHGDYLEDAPYLSKYIQIEAKGITKEGNHYTSPPIFQHFIPFEEEWFSPPEKSSWQ